MDNFTTVKASSIREGQVVRFCGTDFTVKHAETVTPSPVCPEGATFLSFVGTNEEMPYMYDTDELIEIIV